MTRTLLLNASEEPLHILSANRAIRLMMAGKAEVVEESGIEYHSEHETVPVPSILRLRKYVNVPYRSGVNVTTKTVLARDNWTCAYCLGPALFQKGGTMDHIIPRAKGGPHTWENVVAACRRCNHKKGQKTLAQLGWELKITPTRPKGVGAWLLTFEPDESWMEYLQP